jgi:hypothetical protein
VGGGLAQLASLQAAAEDWTHNMRASFPVCHNSQIGFEKRPQSLGDCG